MNPLPTDAELEVLEVIWRLGPSTVRSVHDEISAKRPTGYTTTLKIMQIMLDKGLLDREPDGRAHIYSAKIPQVETRKGLLDKLLGMAFGGSPARLVLHALDSEDISPAELEAIKNAVHKKGGGA